MFNDHWFCDVAGWNHVGLWPKRSVQQFEVEMDERRVFKYDDIRTNRSGARSAIITKIAEDLGPDQSIQPEHIQLALSKVNWESSDELIVDKFVLTKLRNIALILSMTIIHLYEIWF
jgi:hypothetical protein